MPPEVRRRASMLPTMVMPLGRFGGTGGGGGGGFICWQCSAPPPLPGPPQPRRGKRGAPRRLLPPPLLLASWRDCSRTMRSCSSSTLLVAPSSRWLSSIACASMAASSCTDNGTALCFQPGGSVVFFGLLARPCSLGACDVCCTWFSLPCCTWFSLPCCM